MTVHLSVARLPFPADTFDMIFTDPPYVADLLHTYRWLASKAARVLKPGRFIAAMCGGNRLNEVMRWFDESGLQFWWLYQLGMVGQQTGVVWHHGNRVVPISTRTKHVLVYSKGRALPRTATVGLYWAGGIDKRWHHWGQDIDSHRYYIDCLTAEGDLVLNPMAGGGTTGAACELLGRHCVQGDIDWRALESIGDRQRGETLSAYPLFAEATQ